MANRNLIFHVGADIKEFNKAMTQVQKGLKRTFGEDAVNASRTMVGAFAGIGAALAAVGGASITMAANMEQSRIAFTTLLGSAEKAEQFLKELSDFAAETPFELPGLIDASKRLLAFGFQAEEIKPMLTGIGDAIAGLGGGAEEINRVTLALGQMRAKGKVSAEELNQLAELGIPGWEMLAKQIGMSIPEAMKAAERGAISASVAIPAIVKGMNDKFGGLMKQQSSTLLGMWSTAKDNISSALRTIGERMVETFDLKTKLSGATQWLGDFAKEVRDGGIRSALDKMIPENLQTSLLGIAGALTGALIPGLISLGVQAAKAYVPLAPFIIAGGALALVGREIAKGWEQPLVKLGAATLAITALSVAVGKLNFTSLIGAFGPLSAGLTNITFAFKAATTGAATFGEALRFLGLNPVMLVVGALATLVTGIGLYKAKQEEARQEEVRKSESITSLSDRYKSLQAVMDDTTKSEEDRKAAADEQKQVMDELGKIMPGIVTQWDEHKKAVALDTKALEENTQAARENLRDNAQVALNKARETVERLQKQQEKIEAELAQAEAGDARGNIPAGYYGRAMAGAGNVDPAIVLNAKRSALQKELEGIKKDLASAKSDILKEYTFLYGTGDIYGETPGPVYGPPIPPKPEEKKPTGTGGEDPKKEHLDGFTEAFGRAQQEMTTEFERAQDRQTTAFRNAQEDQLTEIENGLQVRRTLYDRQLQDEMDLFDEAQRQETLNFEFEQKKQTQIKQNELDKRLRDFKQAQQDELDAIQKRHDDETLIRNNKLRDAVKPLQDRIKALQGEQKAEEDASKRADLVQRVADAEKELAAARLKGAPAAIEQAERKAADARQNLREWDAKQAREAEISKLEAQIRTLEEGAKAEQEAAEKKLKGDLDKKRTEQLEKLALKEEELRAEMLGFEKILAQDKLNFENRQREAKQAEERRLADLKTAKENELKEELEAFKRKQAQDLTNFQLAQADQATRYKTELEDLKSSLANKLAEQQKFINDWNAGVNQLKAVAVPSLGNANVTGGGRDAALQAAKDLAAKGDLNGAAAMLSSAWSIPLEQAKENLKSVPLTVPKFAKGAVAFQPTLGIFGDTPDGEAVTPLSWLADQIAGVAERVAGSVARLQAPSAPVTRSVITNQTSTTSSKVEHHYHLEPGAVSINARDLKELSDMRNLFTRLPQASRAMG